MAKRTLSRIISLQALYQYDIAKTPLEELLLFNWVKKKKNSHIEEVFLFSKKIIKETIKNIQNIDSYIQKYCQNPSYVTKAILRLSIYFIICEKSINSIIIINEAIFLAKKFSEHNSITLVNGILNSIFKNSSSSIS